jgi:hypothetical protein
MNSGFRASSGVNNLRNVKPTGNMLPNATAAVIISMTTIWYLAASVGFALPRICPVIIPGMLTNPTTISEIDDRSHAGSHGLPHTALNRFPRPAPNESRASSSNLLSFTSA